MRYALAALVIVFLLVVVIGAVVGRVRVRGCCAADPARDRRMRRAGDDLAPLRRPSS